MAKIDPELLLITNTSEDGYNNMEERTILKCRKLQTMAKFGKTKIESEESAKKRKCDSVEHHTCPCCFKMFHNKYTMKTHFKTQHKGKERYNCIDCEKSFAATTSLNYHEKKQHSDSTGIMCDNCDEICPDFKSYKEHIDLHSRTFYDNVGHKCKECGLIIHGKRNLSRHLSEVHNLERKFNLAKTSVPSFPHVCDECNFRTKRKYDLKRAQT